MEFTFILICLEQWIFYKYINLKCIDKWRKSRVFGHCKSEIEKTIWRTQSCWTRDCCDAEIVRSKVTFPNLTTIVSNVEFSDLISFKILNLCKMHVYIWWCIDVLEIPPYVERISSFRRGNCRIRHILRHIVGITTCIDW